MLISEMNIYDVLFVLFVPVLGTVLGCASVFLLKRGLKKRTERMLMGFAAGVMVAASVWSLLLPSIERSSRLGRFSFMPAALGFTVGIFIMLATDKIIPHLNFTTQKKEGAKSTLRKNQMMVTAVIIHNFPEGMAIGAALAAMSCDSLMSVSAAMALSFGIAVQNFPEGAIVSMPLAASGMNKMKAFLLGVASGIVEPVGALLTAVASGFMVASLPYLLSFAAGAMLYVVVEELVPEMNGADQTDDTGTVMFAMGFVLMMALDVMLG